MRVHSMRVENYGPFARLEEITFSSLSTIIGRNDAGKSHTLKALQLFFGKNKLEAGDVYDSADITDQVVIEVSLTALPETLDYEGGAIHLADERLLDTDGRLRVRKMFPCAGPYDRPALALIVQDFADERFHGLLSLKDRELNDRCATWNVPLAEGKRKRTAAEKRARELPVEVSNMKVGLGTGHTATTALLSPTLARVAVACHGQGAGLGSPRVASVHRWSQSRRLHPLRARWRRWNFGRLPCRASGARHRRRQSAA